MSANSFFTRFSSLSSTVQAPFRGGSASHSDSANSPILLDKRLVLDLIGKQEGTSYWPTSAAKPENPEDAGTDAGTWGQISKLSTITSINPSAAVSSPKMPVCNRLAVRKPRKRCCGRDRGNSRWGYAVKSIRSPGYAMSPEYPPKETNKKTEPHDPAFH